MIFLYQGSLLNLYSQHSLAMNTYQQKQVLQQILIRQKQATIFRSTSQSIFPQPKSRIQSSIFHRVASIFETKHPNIIKAFQLDSSFFHRHRIAYFVLFYLLFQKQVQNSQFILQKIKLLVYDENLIIKNFLTVQKLTTRQSIIYSSLVKKKKVGEFLNFMSQHRRQISFIQKINEIVEMDQILINLIASLTKLPLSEDPIQRFLSFFALNVQFKNFNNFTVNEVQLRILSGQNFQIVQKSSLKESISTNDKTAKQINIIPELQLNKLKHKSTGTQIQQLQGQQIPKTKIYQMKNSIIDNLNPFIEKYDNIDLFCDQNQDQLQFLQKSRRRNIQYIETQRLFVENQNTGNNQIQSVYNKPNFLQIDTKTKHLPLYSFQKSQNPQNPQQIKRMDSQLFVAKTPNNFTKIPIQSVQPQAKLFKVYTKEEIPGNLRKTASAKGNGNQVLHRVPFRRSEHQTQNSFTLNSIISPRFSKRIQMPCLISQKSQLTIQRSDAPIYSQNNVDPNILNYQNKQMHKKQLGFFDFQQRFGSPRIANKQHTIAQNRTHNTNVNVITSQRQYFVKDKRY